MLTTVLLLEIYPYYMCYTVKFHDSSFFPNFRYFPHLDYPILSQESEDRKAAAKNTYINASH